MEKMANTGTEEDGGTLHTFASMRFLITTFQGVPIMTANVY